MEVKTLPANFYFDKIGVIVKIEMNADHVFRGELIYDGRNQVILNRNDKEYYLLSSIAPIIRRRILKSQYVTVAETFDDEINQAYDIAVRIVEEIPGEDTYMEKMEQYVAKLEAEIGKDQLHALSREAIHSFEKLSA